MFGIKVLSINLIRDLSRIDMFHDKWVHGILQINFTKKGKFKMYRIILIENRDYVFPEGIFKIKLEYSPKFKQYLWEFKDIPNRTEIKFHQGTKPEHSKGCPLMSKRDLVRLGYALCGKEEYYINVKNY